MLSSSVHAVDEAVAGFGWSICADMFLSELSCSVVFSKVPKTGESASAAYNLSTEPLTAHAIPIKGR